MSRTKGRPKPRPISPADVMDLTGGTPSPSPSPSPPRSKQPSVGPAKRHLEALKKKLDELAVRYAAIQGASMGTASPERQNAIDDMDESIKTQQDKIRRYIDTNFGGVDPTPLSAGTMFRMTPSRSGGPLGASVAPSRTRSRTLDPAGVTVGAKTYSTADRSYSRSMARTTMGRADDGTPFVSRASLSRSPSPVTVPVRRIAPLQYRPIVEGSRRSMHGTRPPKFLVGKEADAHRRAFSVARGAPAQRRVDLSVETPYTGTERNTSYTHLIEGDLAPVGRVHLVKMGSYVGDQRENHIMSQMDADANMGAQSLREQSRRGPFKRSSGRSRIMDRSAHVAYRRRRGAIEITISRGITNHELDTLIAKLGAHRLSTRSAFLYLIKGNSKKLVARLDKVNLEKFRDKIHDCLSKYSTIGLLVQDTFQKGALHKGFSHGMEMKEQMRQMPALFATN